MVSGFEQVLQSSVIHHHDDAKHPPRPRGSFPGNRSPAKSRLPPQWKKSAMPAASASGSADTSSGVHRTERCVPERIGTCRRPEVPGPDIGIGQRVKVVTGRHAVVHLVVADADVEVLRPQHRMPFGQNGFQRGRARVELRWITSDASASMSGTLSSANGDAGRYRSSGGGPKSRPDARTSSPTGPASSTAPPGHSSLVAVHGHRKGRPVNPSGRTARRIVPAARYCRTRDETSRRCRAAADER